MTRPPTRGLGRRISDIVAHPRPRPPEPPGTLVNGPDVVPFAVLPVAMLIVNCDGEALAANANWTELSGLDTASSLGLGWLETVGPQDRQLIWSCLEQTVETGDSTVAELSWSAVSGRWTRWWLQPYEGPGQRLIGVAVAEVDDVRTRWAHEVVADLPDLLDRLDALLVTVSRLV